MKTKLLGLVITGLVFCLASVAQAATQPAQLINLSSRGPVLSGEKTMILGLVIRAVPGMVNPTMRVLIWGKGPDLAKYNVPNPVADPKITLFDSRGNVVTSNDNWCDNGAFAVVDKVSREVGAVPAAPNSKDAALLIDLPVGVYTVHMTAPGTGEGLIEAFDVTKNLGYVMMQNLSFRGSAPVIIGAVVQGIGQKKFLIRGGGPSLGSLGVAQYLPDPCITLYDNTGAVIDSNDNWDSSNGAAITAASVKTGAYAYTSGSKDSAMLRDFNFTGPGSMTARVVWSGSSAQDGVVIVEFFDVPLQ